MSGMLKRRPLAAQVEILEPPDVQEREAAAARQRQVEYVRLLWNRRRLIFNLVLAASVVSTLVALLLPASYTSTAQLMPPDNQSSTGMAMMAALAGKTNSLGAGAGLAGMAGDLLGLKSSGAMFVGVLRSETAQNRIVQQFDLRNVYGKHLFADARSKLDSNTTIVEDRKSGIISLSVSDHNPQRAAAIANSYIDQLNSLVAELSTSAAHRERVFLEQRLKVAKADLDAAAAALARFSSNNNTLDVQTEGKAMLDAAGTLAGQMVVAQSELEGLRQIYTDNNPRVKALSARVGELRKQLERIAGTQPMNSNRRPAADLVPPPAAGDTQTSRAPENGIPFPTIRNLPLLGAKYSDYYRNAKIQETVFEMLTEQYELAKVEEAKETPSVKVLDPGRVPETRSSMSRLRVILIGTALGLVGSILCIFGERKWEQVDPNDPRKLLAQEVASNWKARAHGTNDDGQNSNPGASQKKFWSWFRNHKPTPNAEQ
jgi:uncharacterized protein involved in exopolysaccharide biosynthesis